ncbi:MAG: hypothetical protein J2P37_26750 [Ktedonobacteraceae bacterium]|nr:hypothetical protein [Ktedonobacteraceae bacterium]MBO0789589.1 hypothetical protein [Ktedonobacteraceae bacterium]
MLRQCAWCLCLIDSHGRRISPGPLPKLYEASHGICGACGTAWMEQVVSEDEQGNNQIPQGLATHAVTDLVFELQHQKRETPPVPGQKTRKLRIL